MPSHVISRFDYDALTRRLVIEFVTGRRYAYDGVPPTIVDHFRSAASKGRYFSTYIRNHFPCTKLGFEDPHIID